MNLSGIASTTFILFYAAGTAIIFFASIDIGYIFSAITSSIAFLMILFTPAYWNKAMRIKYWQMCLINIAIIFIVMLTETALKMP